MNRIGRKIALFAAAFSVSACIAEASLVTMTFDIEVLSNTDSISVNGQEIQAYDTIQYTMVLDTSAASVQQQGGSSTYSGSIFQGGRFLQWCRDRFS
jgi:hypothetical protein